MRFVFASWNQSISTEAAFQFTGTQTSLFPTDFVFPIYPIRLAIWTCEITFPGFVGGSRGNSAKTTVRKSMKRLDAQKAAEH
jgi:hypothetical protein